MQGRQTLNDALRQGTGGRVVVNKEEEAGTDGSVSQSVRLFGPAHPFNQEHLTSLRDRRLGAGLPSFRPQTPVRRLWRSRKAVRLETATGGGRDLET